VRSQWGRYNLPSPNDIPMTSPAWRHPTLVANSSTCTASWAFFSSSRTPSISAISSCFWGQRCLEGYGKPQKIHVLMIFNGKIIHKWWILRTFDYRMVPPTIPGFWTVRPGWLAVFFTTFNHPEKYDVVIGYHPMAIVKHPHSWSHQPA
jgi:hypothetical protein